MRKHQKPKVPDKSMLKEYYIYDPGVKETLGGFRCKRKEDGLLHVELTDAQAGYFVAAGMIGRKPLANLSSIERANVAIQTGGRVSAREGEQPLKVTRTAVQNPNTMARAMTEGYHPVLGTTATTEEERAYATDRMRRTHTIGTGREGFADGESRGLRRGE